METNGSQQKLPASGPEREALRRKGQFWTPDWVAEAMVAYAVSGGSDSIFDPAVGAGAFFRAAKNIQNETGKRIKLLGTEIDPKALQQAKESGLSAVDLSNIQITDFVLEPPTARYSAIVANPPYIRHHRLSPSVKAQLKTFSKELIGTGLDGRAGLHIYFLLRALQLLAEDGRLAFIVPADICEGVFAATLWKWITTHYRLDAVITFAPEASPFPNVDTNPVIFLIRNARPESIFSWVLCKRPETVDLKEWMGSSLSDNSTSDLSISNRGLVEALTTGFSRMPVTDSNGGPTLADFAKVLRGIATGANDFFFLTPQQAKELKIPASFLIPAIGRTRDVPVELITDKLLEDLDSSGRPTLLFAPDGRHLDAFPPTVREYLRKGEALGLAAKSLISQRKPWYKMEVRSVPPFLFAYLGRRNTRFIRNMAGVLPLTSFLCVYPKHSDSQFINKLWMVLQHPETVANLVSVGKSYGGGAIKVEPRSLERLPIPKRVLKEVGLGEFVSGKQLTPTGQD
jgi:hypothetical protein